ncbi:MAG TPA: tetratricopeptide repeat protein [Capsulimonadaceae bacterium]|jgi:tetratricopeptide (TPR) repeat protein
MSEQTRKALTEIAEADRRYNLGEVAKGRDWISKAISLSADKQVYVGDSAGNRGVIEVLSAHGDFETLAVLLAKATKSPETSREPQVFESYADALERLGRKAEAKAAYAQLLVVLNKEYPTPASQTPAGQPALLNKAQAQWKSGDTAGARTVFDTVRRLYPDRAAVASNNQAYFAAQDGTDLEEALKLAKEAVAKAEATGDQVVLGQYEDTLGWVYYQIGIRDKSSKAISDAITNLELAITAYPYQGEIYDHLAQAYIAGGRTDEAAIIYARLAGIWVANTATLDMAKKYPVKAVPDTAQPAPAAPRKEV